MKSKKLTLSEDEVEVSLQSFIRLIYIRSALNYPQHLFQNSSTAAGVALLDRTSLRRVFNRAPIACCLIRISDDVTTMSDSVARIVDGLRQPTDTHVELQSLQRLRCQLRAGSVTTPVSDRPDSKTTGRGDAVSCAPAATPLW